MAHTDERVCMTVQLWIVHDGRVLMRRHDKYGFWLGVGGHVDPGEDPLEAAHREAHEEVGLEVTILGEPSYVHGAPYTRLPLPLAVNRHRVTDTHDHFCLEYAALATTAVIAQPDTHERTVCRWCTPDELAELDLSDSTMSLALAALRAAERSPA